MRRVGMLGQRGGSSGIKYVIVVAMLAVVVVVVW